MRSLSDTLDRLSALRTAQTGAQKLGASSGRAVADQLSDLTGFGSNPGALRARTYIPAGLAPNAGLVVVLHGCTQTAAGYDHGAGWSTLAERHGFAVLFPEQQRSNNPNLCFNWYAPGDATREAGEPLSIRQMIDQVVRDHAIDRDRVFVTGLSAGGAMASVMLATYPEVFAGGAIIAGLPYGCAATLPQAFDQMRAQGQPSERALAAKVRGASKHTGPWPTVSVWHGTSDHIVDAANAEAIVGQWRSLQGLEAKPSRTETVDGHTRRIWNDAQGDARIEAYEIKGMGHGVPLATHGTSAVGVSGAYMLEVGISSTEHIARTWGLTGFVKATALRPAAAPTLTAKPNRKPERASAAAPHMSSASGVGKVIEDALRAAGLMR